MKVITMNEKTLECTVPESLEGKPLRQVLIRQLHISRRLLARLKSPDLVTVNGRPVRLIDPVSSGDRILVRLPEDRPVIPVSGQPRLPVLWENSNFLAVYKPAGMPTLPSRRHPGTSVSSCVSAYLRQQGHSGVFRPAGRLDQDTSGILLCAKNSWALELFNRQVRSGGVTKEYLALVEGAPDPPVGEICLPIRRSAPYSMIREVHPAGRPARTSWRVLASGSGLSLVRLTLHTGRTHQIRVHMSHLGHPLAGDPLYGGSGPDRTALHAFRLSFTDPTENRTVMIRCRLPEDMLHFWQSHLNSGRPPVLPPY